MAPREHDPVMDKRAAQIATICECIDHCFAYAGWCEDFVPFLDPEDMVAASAGAREETSMLPRP
jgi:hypothetical protein